MSASTDKARPAWQQVLGMVDKGQVDVILAWHLDRITRSMLDLEQLILRTQGAGVGVATATGDIDLTTDTGRMVARILAAVARGEVERKSARQVAAEEQRVSRGKQRWAHRPFGYEKDGTLREGESEHLRQAYLDIAKGTRLSAIRDRWNSSGVKTTTGGDWSTQALGNLFRHPRNKARITYQGRNNDAGPGGWEPIVSEDEWQDALAVLNSPERRRGRAAKSDAWLVTVAKCGKCEGRVFTEQRKTETERSYTCQKGCIHLPQRWTDARVLIGLAGILDQPGFKANWTRHAEKVDESLSDLRAEHVAKSERLRTLGEDFADGLIDRETMLAASVKLRERLTALEDEIEGLTRASSDVRIDTEYLTSYLHDASTEEKRDILRQYTSAVILHRRGKGSRMGLRPELVQVVPPIINQEKQS